MSASHAPDPAASKQSTNSHDTSAAQKEAVPVATERIGGPKRDLAAPRTTALSVPSPYRFPIPRTQTLALVARVIGLCFVVTGALLSLLSLADKPILSSADDRRAEMSALVPFGQTIVPVEQEAVSPTSSSIAISVPSGTVHGVVPITITATADRVTVYAQKRTGSKTKLGTAKQSNIRGVWNFEWDTKRLKDDTYTLSVIAQINDVAHERIHDVPVTVQNSAANTPDTKTPVPVEDQPEVTVPGTTPVDPTVTPDTGNVPTSTATTTPPKDTAETTETKTVVSLRASQSTVREYAPLKVHVSPSAHLVRVSAYNTATGALYQAGIAEQVSDLDWQLSWDTTQVVNGTYRLVATASVQNAEYESTAVTVTVRNETVTPTTTVATTVPKQSEIEDIEIVVEPTITLTVSAPSPLSDQADVTIVTEGATSIELYRQPVQSLSPVFLGQARRIDASRWSYTWNTHETPNGEYQLFARVQNAYGVTESARTRVQVKNMVLDTFTVEQAQEIDTLTKASDVLVRPVETVVAPPTAPDVPKTPKTVYIEPVTTFVTSIDTGSSVRSELEELLRDFRKELDSAMTELAQALRRDDADAVRAVRDTIESLKGEILTRIPDSADRDAILDRVTSYLDKTTRELDALTVRNDTLLKERIGDAVMQDSDKDGISDYDEIHLYQTNPFTADTDGDGFIDSVEITQGYDPHDSRSEAVIAYESPQEIGVVREDLLQIESVSSLTFAHAEEGEKTQALFSGKGLPNSFVTLYIYSTPIIVTVKTDTDGNWNYVLDKDLEDGDHEIYVGITDNGGRLVAKSNPLPFVKTAEAYTAGTSIAATEDEGAPTFLGMNAMIFASSFIVLVLGLALLLIGMFARPRVREDDLIMPSS